MQPGTRGRKYTASISRHNTQHFSVKMSENILSIFCVFSYLWCLASGRESEWGGKSATATKHTANETLKHYPADETRGGKTSGGCWWRQQLPWSHATFVLTERPGAAQITRCALSRDQKRNFPVIPRKTEDWNLSLCPRWPFTWSAAASQELRLPGSRESQLTNCLSYLSYKQGRNLKSLDCLKLFFFFFSVSVEGLASSTLHHPLPARQRRRTETQTSHAGYPEQMSTTCMLQRSESVYIRGWKRRKDSQLSWQVMSDGCIVITCLIEPNGRIRPSIKWQNRSFITQSLTGPALDPCNRHTEL